jgi:Raf kinase inhibitor-like YbhB/YbcL family protein
MAGIELYSPAFDDHGTLPRRLSRQGGNVSPPLEWSGVPEGAAELVLICEDPDGSGPEPFLHWLVSGIDPASGEIGEGAAPPGGRQWPNGFGEQGWGGPAPPAGDRPHRYVFRLLALDQQLDLPERASARDVRQAAEEHELASGSVVGLFAR